MKKRVPHNKIRLHIGHRYAWPNPLASEDQLRKFLGLDIGAMTPFERWREIKQLENAIIWLKDDDEILYYHPLKPTKCLAWAVDRIRKLKQLPAATMGVGS